MTQIRPFRGVRPPRSHAPDLIAPPYDTVSESEARALAGPNEQSFLHVTRPEVDLPEGADPHGDPAYAKARENFKRFRSEGWLVQDDFASMYLYTQTWDGKSQTGLVCLCSIDEYDKGVIKRHETTRLDKELDRVRHIEALDAQTGLVFLTYRERPELRAAIASLKGGTPLWETTTADGVQHALSIISEPIAIERIQRAFREAPNLYVADGHHRTAAASRVAARRSSKGSSGWFMAGLFADTDLRILSYNRVVKDLNGHDAKAFLAAVKKSFSVKKSKSDTPKERGRISMYFEGAWYDLVPKEVPDDPVGSLDAQILQDQLLEPVLGIEDPRKDTRIEFVGGIRGAAALQEAVDGDQGKVAFHLFPTGMDQLLRVADADELMPPKSTWFEPKLRGGVLVHMIT